MWNKNFLLLWFGQAISQIGNRIYVMALAWYIVAVMNSPGKMIVLFIISSLPSLLFGTLITLLFIPVLYAMFFGIRDER